MVPNHKQVAVGDTVVLRDNAFVHGVARIGAIDAMPGRKLQLRCPECGNTGLKERVKGLRYYCDRQTCKARFDHPQQETVEVTTYVARYGESWSPLMQPVRVDALKELYASNGTQHAIRPLKEEALLDRLTAWGWSDAAGPGGLRPAERIVGGHTLRLARQRRGQRQFRRRSLSTSAASVRSRERSRRRCWKPLTCTPTRPARCTRSEEGSCCAVICTPFLTRVCW